MIRDKSFYKMFFALALSLALQNLLVYSVNMMDTVMLGRYSQNAMSGVSLCNQVQFLLQMLVVGAGEGAVVLGAQYWGKNKLEPIPHIIGAALRFGGAMAVAMFLVVLFAPEQLLGLLSNEPLVIAEGVAYFRIICYSYIVFTVTNILVASLRSIGIVNIGYIISFSTLCINVCLNYLLIYGNFGFPELGVKGAAVATAIAAFVSMAINVGYTYLNRHCGALKLHDFIKLPSVAFIRDYFKKVIPVVVNEGLWSLGITTYAIFHGMYSDAAISAIAVYNNLDQLMTVMVFGVVNATSIMIGNAIGEDDREKARLTAFRMLFAIEVLSLFTGTMLITLRNPLLSVYGSISALSAEALEKASVITLIAGCFMPIRFFNSLNIVGVLRAGGDTIFSMVLDAGSVWVFGVPCVAIAATVLHLPIEGVYAASLVEEFFKMAFGLPRFLSGKWIHNLTHIGEPENAK